MKKLVNDPTNVVREMLEGLAMTTPNVVLAQDANVIMQNALPPFEQRKVAVISGGGSGHEPAHAGFVGRGMLTAAVCGNVFASPDVDSILGAIVAVSGPAGALLVVKNYTGDRLNFGLAAELACQKGIPTEVVLVGDDVSLRDLVPADRRRGIAGTILVHKIAGALADQSRSLAEVAAAARAVSSSLATMGVGLGACVSPGTGKASFELGNEEIEYGLGIHGEKGVRRDTHATAEDIVDVLLSEITNELPSKKGDCVLLVNGLGGTPLMELHIIARSALNRLHGMGWRVRRSMVGNVMTALEMPGASLTVLPLQEEWEQLLSENTEAAAWPRHAGELPAVPLSPSILLPEAQEPTTDRPSEDLKLAAHAVATSLLNAEGRLTDLDAQAGDGDLGVSMKRAAQAIIALPDGAYASLSGLLRAVAQSVRHAVGGSSGPLNAVGLLAAARVLDESNGRDWGATLEAAAQAIAQLGGAQSGDRTMLDALLPAADAFKMALAEGQIPAHGLAAASRAAEEGATKTANMLPRHGRASYMGDRVRGVPDGGAVAVSIWLAALHRWTEGRLRENGNSHA